MYSCVYCTRNLLTVMYRAPYQAHPITSAIAMEISSLTCARWVPIAKRAPLCPLLAGRDISHPAQATPTPAIASCVHQDIIVRMQQQLIQFPAQKVIIVPSGRRIMSCCVMRDICVQSAATPHRYCLAHSSNELHLIFFPGMR